MSTQAIEIPFLTRRDKVVDWRKNYIVATALLAAEQQLRLFPGYADEGERMMIDFFSKKTSVLLALDELEVLRDGVQPKLTLINNIIYRKLSVTIHIVVLFNRLILELLLVGVSVACSEAIAKTYGSVMEVYHQNRFLNNEPTNYDVRLEQEIFLGLNGPHWVIAIISAGLKHHG